MRRCSPNPARFRHWVWAGWSGWVGGRLLLAVGDSVRPALDWVWPPLTLGLALWTSSRACRLLPRRSGGRLVYPVMALLALASIGAGFETVAEAADTRAHLMPGQLVDIGGHRLHLSCTGTGSPTVVLEPGAGEMAANLGWITPAVARTTRVCAYDRAGRGWSDPTDTPPNGARIATDLHTLLHRAGVPAPYVYGVEQPGDLPRRTRAWSVSAPAQRAKRGSAQAVTATAERDAAVGKYPVTTSFPVMAVIPRPIMRNSGPYGVGMARQKCGVAHQRVGDAEGWGRTEAVRVESAGEDGALGLSGSRTRP